MTQQSGELVGESVTIARTFDSFDRFMRFADALEFGYVEDITLAIAEDDHAWRAARFDSRTPIRKFAKVIEDHGGCVHFLVIKVQNGLPVHGETLFAGLTGAVKSHKFT